MGSHVQGKEARLDKTLFADVALKWPFPSMVPPVYLQFCGGSERLIAVVALERPFARVNQRMPHQSILAKEALSTVLAWETQPFVVEVIMFQKASSGSEGLAALSAGEGRRGFLDHGFARVMHPLHVPRQCNAVPELLAAFPAEEGIRFSVFLLVLHEVRVRSESFAAVSALKRLVTGVFPLVSDESLQTAKGGLAVGAGKGLRWIVDVDVVLVKGLEHREILLTLVTLKRSVGLFVHCQRLRVPYQFHAHLAVERVVGLFVGIQCRFVLECFVTFITPETMLNILRLLGIHLLLIVANVS